MAKVDILSQALSEWAFKVAKSILPQVHIPVGGKLAGLMQVIGVNPATYNIWNELGFLAEPLIHNMLSPAVVRLLQGVPDEQVEELAIKYVDAFIARSKEKGAVNVFGVEIEEAEWQELKTLLQTRLNNG